MHVLLYSKPFFPDTGGLETVSLTLAEQIVLAGHACTVVTETPARPEIHREFPFCVERTPSRMKRLALVRAADIVHSNGAALALFPYAKIARKPFLWTHAGYQMVSIDGLGWLDGEPAPLTPFASVRWHARKRGIRRAAVGAAKLGVRRIVGHLVDKNVAITNWVADRQPLPNQVVIYNPFPLARFKRTASRTDFPRYDFLFVGRLVEEKGLRTLLRALASLNRRPGRSPATLLIVGGGERAALEQLSLALGLGPQVTFLGTKRDNELLEAMGQAQVAVVPSEWEEPMGGVAMELLAAGLPLIVSARGGLAECAGEAAWTFPNGDHEALAAIMARVLDDASLRASKAAEAQAVVGRFNEVKLAREYLDLYSLILSERS